MKLWAGRFSKSTDEIVDDFNSSISFDKRLFQQDIQGSISHAQMLAKQGIILQSEAEAIVNGLLQICQEMQEGKVAFTQEHEDIHMLVETLLTQKIGAVGKKLHTGRSRNDQVALDMHMYAKESCEMTMESLKELCKSLLNLAKKHLYDIMPGYTHLQRAQPITLAHYLMAYFQMFARDITRFENALQSADHMPLGAGALAGTTYPLDREFVAQELGFSSITQNSLDSVSDRDYLLDYMSGASICMMHLSRFCEEMILYASTEFSFITLDDAFSTGSSMMPQKKNPDVAELIRGKTGRVYGDLTTLLTVMKGLPLAYNKDMQEDKECFFDARDTLLKCLKVFQGMLNTTTFHTERMQANADKGFTNATDCADYLVKKGIPFRDAHEVVGKLVAHCLMKKKGLLDLELQALQAFSPVFEEDVYEALSLNTCVNMRSVAGGPSPATVLAEIKRQEKRFSIADGDVNE